ncbi:WD40/YVTN/BNR-like repeat-containing protein [Paenibacillus sp. MBLB4367]|uniref:WD40/YVTN/BNR-like repeat-containing protein n=1 Tax=Paenibacillus sp. MBLB4367 TaxID=3384767 RepID=UPI00390828E7
MSMLRKMKLTLVASALFIGITGCRGSAGTPQGTEGRTLPPSAVPSNQESPSPAPADAGTPNAPSAKPTAAAHTGKVTAVRLADAKSGWTGGEGWIARTDDAGKTWSMQYQGAGTVRQLFALNGQDAWATLDGSNEGSEAGSYSLLNTADGGKHWAKTGAVPNQGFLHFVSKSEAYSANAKTTDGGKTWSSLPVPERMVGDAYFHDAKNGWAVTQDKEKASIVRTTDGGKAWTTVMSRPIADPLAGTVIRSAGANDAWVEWIGGSGMTQTSYSLFHSSDGGKQWQTVLANSTAGAGPAPGIAIDDKQGAKNAGSGPGPLYVVNPSAAFMGGYCGACDLPNTVGKTTDGGKTWINGAQSIEGYAGALLAMADDKQGWWIGTDNTAPSVMYTTSDGGAHWSKAHTFDKPKSAS